jgi:hypothetical protein
MLVQRLQIIFSCVLLVNNVFSPCAHNIPQRASARCVPCHP